MRVRVSIILKSMTALPRIAVGSGNNVGDAGALALAQAINCAPQLAYVNLNGKLNGRTPA
jgi:hypothetical protein